MTQLNQTITKSSDQVSCDLEGEVAVLQLGSGRYYGLDGVGLLLWQCLDAPSTVQELVRAVVDSFEVSVEVATTDVVSFIEELHEQGLVQVGT